VVHIVHDVCALEVLELGDAPLGDEPAPHAGMAAPEAADRGVEASRAPIALHQVLVAGELLDEPIG
jgi:hypothetical protein